MRQFCPSDLKSPPPQAGVAGFLFDQVPQPPTTHAVKPCAIKPNLPHVNLAWLASCCAAAIPLTVAATSLQLGFTVPSSLNESNRQAVLAWNAEPAKTYLVQSADDLSHGSVWKTEEPVTATKVGPVRWMASEALKERKYYRLGLPQPEVFSVEPAFIDSGDPNALLYVFGQCLPTNGTVVINGQNFTPTLVDTNGGWVAISLKTMQPGQPVYGNIVMLDGDSNIVATLPLQSPVFYGAEMTTEQLQGPPEEPPASAHVKITKSRSNIQNNRLGGGGDDYDDSDYSPSVSGPKITKSRSNIQNNRMASGGVDYHASGAFFKTVSGLKSENEASDYQEGGVRGGMKTVSGEFLFRAVDLVIPGVGLDFAWTRTYRSRTGPTTAQGQGWDFSYNVSLTQQPDGTLVLRPGNGRADTFYPNGTNGWARDEYFVEIRDLNSDGMPDVLFADGGKWLFHPLGSAVGGKLRQIVDRNANLMTLEYDGAGRLASIVDDLDRTNTLAYNLAGQIASVTDSSGRTMSYEYDGNGDLAACVSPAITGTPNGNDFPGGKTNRYAYSSGLADPRLNHNLTALTDPKGQTWLQVTYQATNNPTSPDFDAVSSLLRGIEKAQIKRGMVIVKPNTPRRMRAIVNDGVGNVCESDYDSRQRLVELREFTGRANPDLPTTATENRPTGKLRPEDPDYFTTQFEWNPDSLCTRVVSPRGDSVEMVYERAFNQNSARANRRHAGDLRIVRDVACCNQDDDGDGLPDSLTTTFEYDPRFGSSPTTGSGKISCNYVRRERTTYSGSLGSLGKKLYAGNLPFSSRDGGYGDTVVARAPNKAPNITHEYHRFANGPRQTTSMDGSYGGAANLKFRARFPLVDNSFVTATTDPRGIVTTAEYDDQGNQSKQATLANNGGNGVEVRASSTRHNSRGQLTAITNAPDATGFARVDTFEYYTNGPQKGYLKSCVMDAGGLALTESYECDARGNVTRFINSRGHDTLYTYNALDQLVRYQSPTNLTARCTTDITYDANDNVVASATELRDENDAFVRMIVTRGTFDVLDRPVALVQQVSASSFVTNIFSYDANGNVAVVYSPLAVSGADPNNFVTFQYDERDFLFREIAAPGSGNSLTNEWSYDPNGKIKRFNCELYVEQMRFDGFGRFASITDAMSNVVTYAYDRNDNLISQRVDAEPNDGPGSAGNLRYHEWRWRYNALDQCIEARAEFFDPATQLPIGDGSSVTTFSNAPNGQLVSVTDDNSHTTSYGYDNAGRLASVTGHAAKVVTAVFRDQAGNASRVTQTDRSDLGGPPQVFFHTNVFDSLNRCVSTTDNVGNTDRAAYDSLDNVVSSVDARGNETVFAYDDLSRCVQTTGYEGLGRGITINTSHVEYNSNSRSISTTDSNTNTTFHAYDSLDRLVQTTEADGTSSSLVWNPRSNLILQQDANGTVISNSFDLLNRCVRRDITPGAGVAATTTFEAFGYDGISQLVAATNDTTHNEFAYDSMGRHTRGVSGGIGAVVTTRDGVGNRLSTTYPSGRVVTYTYDALDQVTNVSSSAGGLPPTTLATFAYEGPGRVGRITRANNVNTRVQWNGLVAPPNIVGDFGSAQVSGINHQVAGGGAVIDRRVFTYDQAQNKTLRAQTAPFYQGGDMTTNILQYDAVDRLSRSTKLHGSEGDRFDYTLDGVGNRQSVAYINFTNGGVLYPYLMAATIPPADFQMNQYTLTPFVVAPEQYDANGNLIGRTTASAQLQYVYDYADRLVTVNDLFTGALVPVVSFSYDALGQRSSKTIYPSGLPPVTTEYVHDTVGYKDNDHNRMSGILATRVAGNPAASREYAAKQTEWENWRNQVLAGDMIAAFSGSGEVLHYHSDDLGNVLALTDAGGNVVERYDYDDYGSPIFLSTDGLPTGETESGVGNPFLFRGMEWDAETGFYHNETRGEVIVTFQAKTGKTGKAKQSLRYADPNTGRGVGTSGGNFGDNNPWSGAGGAKSQDLNSSRSNKSGITDSDGRIVRKMIPVTGPDITGNDRRVTVNGSGANWARVQQLFYKATQGKSGKAANAK